MSAFTIQDAQSANIQLVSDESKGSQAVHDLVVAYQANRRSGTAQAKTRGEVNGTGKKMYRQKGTGNARHGDRKAPIFVGGGVAFGPRNRSYAKTVPKKVRTLALQRVLGDKVNEGAIFRAASLDVESGKTKDFVAALKSLTDAKKVLVIGGAFTDRTYYAARNVQSALLQTVESVNVEQILHSNAVIILDDALETLANRTA
ncbi:MAG: 50S ribosomal protein L4 [Verrucomicrobiales bacterium]|nr:50S ribosomal protein L4 [Verrucomicrobiales bacterium]|tara:strand:+ start:496 stop:1101 length:606 start_codon:yes stop_codon:yes gene_type:complete